MYALILCSDCRVQRMIFDRQIRCQMHFCQMSVNRVQEQMSRASQLNGASMHKFYGNRV